MAASGEWSQALTSYLAFSTGTRIPSVDACIHQHETVYAAEVPSLVKVSNHGTNVRNCARLTVFILFFLFFFWKLFSWTVAKQSWHFDVHAGNDSLCAQQRYFNIFPLSLIKTKPKFVKKIYRLLYLRSTLHSFSSAAARFAGRAVCNICLKTFTQHSDISRILGKFTVILAIERLFNNVQHEHCMINVRAIVNNDKENWTLQLIS